VFTRQVADIITGKYSSQIDQCLADAGQPEADGGRDDLFHCVGGSNGVIRFRKYCSNGCRDNGAGVSDTCN